MENDILAYADYIRKARREGRNYNDISAHLASLNPGKRGFSARTIRRFCAEHGIRRTTRLATADLKLVVATAVNQVGPTYGRKTMQGLLRSQGIVAGQKQVGHALAEVRPDYHQRRLSRTESELNPHPYFAAYFGHKLHIDQNEKLVMFGVTHIAAIDGFSRKIVGFITLPVKNNVEIYKHLFRPALMEYGLWDEIRVDHGKEWVLSLFIQEKLAQYRTNPTRPPHLQTKSTKNHVIERLWVEINKRVNYPVKKALVDMENRRVIETEDQSNTLHRFCVSWVTIRIVTIGTRLAVQAWNEHSIPGHGIPNIKAEERRTAALHQSLLPSPEEAVSEFKSTGGHLQLFSKFGEDPLISRPDLQQMRQADFEDRYPSLDSVYHRIVNLDPRGFEEVVLYFIRMNERLSSTL